ncbi:MAG TPA: gluconate 2-dehydrogenase subunit 3 family protein [Candidatus Eremiobacteraceae bacterium]|nr:gluconate 2-dehydrogenase subunit 3 family protein [Candidatus Eremiobacteraceae bacterium]
MKPDQGTRRNFLLQISGAAGVAWINAQWPAIVAAAQHAHNTVHSKSTAKFEVLTPEQARQVEAIAAQIIPSDELPGAREAGVVYFIDHALKTFAKDSLPTYVEGLAQLNELTGEKFPGTKSFADATPEQQEAVLTELTSDERIRQRRRPIGPEGSRDFFQTIRMDVVLGFLADPSAGGNQDYAGWKVVQRDAVPSFSPPFGYYDKDYAGWQAVKAEMERK